MKPLDDILPNIRPYAPGVADPTAYFGIRQAAIEFCERTRLWRFDDSFTTSTEAEPIMAPSGAVIHEIEHVTFDGMPLEAKTVTWLDDNMAGWRTGDLTGQPQFFAQLEPNTILVTPVAAGTLSVSLWLKPAQNAQDLPDFLVDQYRQVIAHGALSHILIIPNQSFTSPEMAMAFGGAFQQRLDSLSTKGTTGQQRARVRTRASFF